MDFDRLIEGKRLLLAGAPAADFRNITPSTRDFRHYVSTERDEIAIIAELRRVDPLYEELRPQELGAVSAGEFTAAAQDGDAYAVSICTNAQWHGGDLADVGAASRAAILPVLRRDLIVDDSELYASRTAGADAVLLMAELHDASTLRMYGEISRSMHMHVVVEAYNDETLQTALASNVEIVGISALDPRGDRDLERARDLCVRLGEAVRTVILTDGIQTVEELESFQGLLDAAIVFYPFMRCEDLRSSVEEFARAGSGD